MTAQASDSFFFHGIEHSLAGICGEGLFRPEEHGFTPEGKDTACWRGYVCTYALKGDQLQLEGLLINNGVWQGRTYQPSPAPPFGGSQPVTQTQKHLRFDLQYKDIGLQVAFSGGILVATDFIRELYVHMGFHPAWKYRKVTELVFKNGRLTSEKDVSSELNSYRTQFKNKNAPPSSDEKERIEAWIDETFSLRYGV